MPYNKKAPRDPRGYLFHLLDAPGAELAPPEKLTSLREKLSLYDDISKRLDNGLLPEDALTAILNQVIHLASAVSLPDEILGGWFREELRAYRRELKAGGFDAIMFTPDIPRPFEEKVHDHFASRR